MIGEGGGGEYEGGGGGGGEGEYEGGEDQASGEFHLQEPGSMSSCGG